MFGCTNSHKLRLFTKPFISLFKSQKLFFMRLCNTFLLFLLLSITATAQTTVFDFEGDAPAIVDFNGSTTTIIDNPDMTAPNTSAKVAQNFIVAGSSFAGSKTPFAINLANGKTFTMQVWSSLENAPVLLKFEGGTSADIERAATFTGAANSWQELTFDFSDEADLSFADVVVFMNFNVVDGADRTFFWDNLVQQGSGGGGSSSSFPMTPAPSPQDPADEVTSVFSDAYTNVMVDTYRTDWSQGDLVDTMIQGNATLKYENLDFIGIETTTSPLDLSAPDAAMHIDYWSANGTFFGIKLVDFGADGVFGGGDDVEHQIDFTNELIQGEWVSLDLALEDFAGLTTRSNIAQIVLVGQPTGANDVYIDNIYFYASELSVSQMRLPVDFEGDDIDYGLADFGGNESLIVTDPTDPTNTVAQSTKRADAETWAGTTLSSTSGGPDGFASRIPFSTSASIISVRVWSPTAGTPVLVKVENASDPTISVETLTNTTVAGAWETLEFDFKNEADGTAAINYSAAYNKLSIFFNFGTAPGEAMTYYWDDIVFTGTTGETTAEGPMTAAPTPTVAAEDVISLFSDAYTDVTVNTFRTDWSESSLVDTLIEGNATKRYQNLNFNGIETIGENAIDLVGAGMTHLHIDFWSANSTNFRTKLVDFGGDGFGGDNDTEFEIAMDLAQGEWVGLDYPLSSFTGMNQSDINQLVISSTPAGMSDVWIDNIYFYKGGAVLTQMDLPVTFEDENVDYGLEDFAGAASMIVADPEDAANTVVSTTKTAGAATFAGTVLTSTSGGPGGFANAIPLAEGASTMSVRVWSPTAGTPVRLKIEQEGEPTISVETEAVTNVAGAWDVLVFDFSAQAAGTAPVDYSAVYDKAVIFFDFGSEPTEDATYYWDNVELGGTVVEVGPMGPAPTPTVDAADVISLFSDAYINVAVDTFITEWSDATLTDTLLEGNATLLYRDLAFAGIETIGENAIDLMAAGMTHLHIDFWSANSTTFGVKLVDFGGDGFGGDNDTEFEITRDLAQRQWVGVEYPLSAFVGMNQSDISQFIISSAPGGASDVWIDNIYFYAGEALGSQMDLPVTFDEADVDYGLAGFGGVSSTIVVDPTDSNNTVAQSTKTAGAETWGGTTLTSTSGGPDGFASRIPFAADANVITVRVWSPTAGTPFLLKAEQTDDPTVSVETLASTTVAGEWETLSFDFSNEAPGTAAINYASVYQKLSIFPNFGTSPTEDEVYYWDDVMFEGGNTGGGDDEPMQPAPTPTRLAENVISMFSDAYTDVAVDTWRTEWSAADLEDIEIQGNPTKKYTNLNFVGAETIASPINLTDAGMTHLHINYWTPNMDTVRVKLVDFGMDGFGGGNDTEAEPIFMTTKNEWVTLEIPLEDFAGMAQTDISQFILSGLPAGAGTLYIDNVYFYKDIPDGTNTPEVGLLEAYPNPVGEMVNIVAPARMNELTLYNFSGQVVGNWAPNAEQFDVPMSKLPAGNYVALVSTDEGLMTIKLVKQ